MKGNGERRSQTILKKAHAIKTPKKTDTIASTMILIMLAGDHQFVSFQTLRKKGAPRKTNAPILLVPREPSQAFLNWTQVLVRSVRRGVMSSGIRRGLMSSGKRSNHTLSPRSIRRQSLGFRFRPERWR